MNDETRRPREDRSASPADAVRSQSNRPNRLNQNQTSPSPTGEAQAAATEAVGPEEAVNPEENVADCAQLEHDLAEARDKAQSYLDLAQRTQADFLNYKRRVELERSEFARSARADTLLKVIPVIDDLDRAVEALPPDLAGSDWVQGIVLIDRKLRSTLESLGLQRIAATGAPFDPWTEEAVLHEPSGTVPAGSVIQVIRPGYSLDGKVIRAAQVIVSSGPPEQAAT